MNKYGSSLNHLSLWLKILTSWKHIQVSAVAVAVAYKDSAQRNLVERKLWREADATFENQGETIETIENHGETVYRLLSTFLSIDLYFSLISVKIRQQIRRWGRHQDTRRQLFKTKERIRFSTTISKTTMSCHEIYQTYFHGLCFVFLHCNFLYATNIILRIRCSNHPDIDQPDTKKWW